jgi:hypothetical protein
MSDTTMTSDAVAGETGAETGGMNDAYAGRAYADADTTEAGGVPDVYALNLPEDLTGRVEVSPDHPLYAPASDWARKWNLPQAAFDELVAIQAGHEAGSGIDQGAERTKLIEAFSEGGRLSPAQAQAKADEIGRWAVGLLSGEARRNPAILGELIGLTATADGVALLRALKSRVGEARPPRAGQGSGGSPAVSTEEFYRELFRGRG